MAGTHKSVNRPSAKVVAQVADSGGLISLHAHDSNLRFCVMEHVLDGDGVKAELFYLLAKQPLRSVYVKVGFRIPDTVVFQNFPVAWVYFDNERRDIQKQRGQKLERETIYAAFTEGFKEHEICATFYHTKLGPHTAVSYYTSSELRALLFGDTRVTGLLQRFIPPTGPCNVVLQVVWSPSCTLVSRRRNRLPMSTRGVPAFSRAVTFEGPAHLSEEVLCAPTTRSRYAAVCQSLADHFNRVEFPRFEISRMVLYFKEGGGRGRDGAGGRDGSLASLPWLLFSSNLKVREARPTKVPGSGANRWTTNSLAAHLNSNAVSITPHFRGVPRGRRTAEETVVDRYVFVQELIRRHRGAAVIDGPPHVLATLQRGIVDSAIGEAAEVPLPSMAPRDGAAGGNAQLSPGGARGGLPGAPGGRGGAPIRGMLGRGADLVELAGLLRSLPPEPRDLDPPHGSLHHAMAALQGGAATTARRKPRGSGVGGVEPWGDRGESGRFDGGYAGEGGVGSGFVPPVKALQQPLPAPMSGLAAARLEATLGESSSILASATGMGVHSSTRWGGGEGPPAAEKVSAVVCRSWEVFLDSARHNPVTLQGGSKVVFAGGTLRGTLSRNDIAVEYGGLNPGFLEDAVYQYFDYIDAARRGIGPFAGATGPSLEALVVDPVAGEKTATLAAGVSVATAAAAAAAAASAPSELTPASFSGGAASLPAESFRTGVGKPGSPGSRATSPVGGRRAASPAGSFVAGSVRMGSASVGGPAEARPMSPGGMSVGSAVVPYEPPKLPERFYFSVPYVLGKTLLSHFAHQLAFLGIGCVDLETENDIEVAKGAALTARIDAEAAAQYAAQIAAERPPVADVRPILRADGTVDEDATADAAAAADAAVQAHYDAIAAAEATAAAQKTAAMKAEAAYAALVSTDRAERPFYPGGLSTEAWSPDVRGAERGGSRGRVHTSAGQRVHAVVGGVGGGEVGGVGVYDDTDSDAEGIGVGAGEGIDALATSSGGGEGGAGGAGAGAEVGVGAAAVPPMGEVPFSEMTQAQLREVIAARSGVPFGWCRFFFTTNARRTLLDYLVLVSGVQRLAAHYAKVERRAITSLIDARARSAVQNIILESIRARKDDSQAGFVVVTAEPRLAYPVRVPAWVLATTRTVGGVCRPLLPIPMQPYTTTLASTFSPEEHLSPEVVQHIYRRWAFATGGASAPPWRLVAALAACSPVDAGGLGLGLVEYRGHYLRAPVHPPAQLSTALAAITAQSNVRDPLSLTTAASSSPRSRGGSGKKRKGTKSVKGGTTRATGTRGSPLTSPLVPPRVGFSDAMSGSTWGAGGQVGGCESVDVVNRIAAAVAPLSQFATTDTFTVTGPLVSRTLGPVVAVPAPGPYSGAPPAAAPLFARPLGGMGAPPEVAAAAVGTEADVLAGYRESLGLLAATPATSASPRTAQQAVERAAAAAAAAAGGSPTHSGAGSGKGGARGGDGGGALGTRAPRGAPPSLHSPKGMSMDGALGVTGGGASSPNSDAEGFDVVGGGTEHPHLSTLDPYVQLQDFPPPLGDVPMCPDDEPDIDFVAPEAAPPALLVEALESSAGRRVGALASLVMAADGDDVARYSRPSPTTSPTNTTVVGSQNVGLGAAAQDGGAAGRVGAGAVAGGESGAKGLSGDGGAEYHTGYTSDSSGAVEGGTGVGGDGGEAGTAAPRGRGVGAGATLVPCALCVRSDGACDRCDGAGSLSGKPCVVCDGSGVCMRCRGLRFAPPRGCAAATAASVVAARRPPSSVPFSSSFRDTEGEGGGVPPATLHPDGGVGGAQSTTHLQVSSDGGGGGSRLGERAASGVGSSFGAHGGGGGGGLSNVSFEAAVTNLLPPEGAALPSQDALTTAAAQLIQRRVEDARRVREEAADAVGSWGGSGAAGEGSRFAHSGGGGGGISMSPSRNGVGRHDSTVGTGLDERGRVRNTANLFFGWGRPDGAGWVGNAGHSAGTAAAAAAAVAAEQAAAVSGFRVLSRPGSAAPFGVPIRRTQGRRLGDGVAVPVAAPPRASTPARRDGAEGSDGVGGAAAGPSVASGAGNAAAAVVGVDAVVPADGDAEAGIVVGGDNGRWRWGDEADVEGSRPWGAASVELLAARRVAEEAAAAEAAARAAREAAERQRVAELRAREAEAAASRGGAAAAAPSGGVGQSVGQWGGRPAPTSSGPSSGARMGPSGPPGADGAPEMTAAQSAAAARAEERKRKAAARKAAKGGVEAGGGGGVNEVD